MKDVLKRFNIEIDLKRAQEMFAIKINNHLSNTLGFEKVFKDFQVIFNFCNEIGIQYSRLSNLSNIMRSYNFPFYVLDLQILLNLLYEIRKTEYSYLERIVDVFIAESPVDLGIKLKKYKRKPSQIFLSGSKLLDEKLIDDSLGILDNNESQAIKVAFEKGLKEFMESVSKPEKHKNVVRDMQLACDESIKVLFKDKNLGFKHLFTKENWKKLGLNDYQKQIFWNLNEYIDKFAKHKADAEISHKDAEFVIYQTGMFLRLVFQ